MSDCEYNIHIMVQFWFTPPNIIPANIFSYTVFPKFPSSKYIHIYIINCEGLTFRVLLVYV